MRRYLFEEAHIDTSLELDAKGYGGLGLIPGMVESSASICLLGGGMALSPLISIVDALYAEGDR